MNYNFGTVSFYWWSDSEDEVGSTVKSRLTMSTIVLRSDIWQKETSYPMLADLQSLGVLSYMYKGGKPHNHISSISDTSITQYGSIITNT